MLNSYNSKKAIKRTLNVFGSKMQIDAVNKQILWPFLYDFSPYGSHLSYTPTYLGETIDRVRQSLNGVYENDNGDRGLFKEMNVFIPMEDDTVVEKKIKDMTTSDFIRLRTYKGEREKEFDINAANYVKYHLSREEVILPLIQMIYPKVNIESIYESYRTGGIVSGQAGNQRYISNDEMNPEEGMSALLNKQMEATPLWSIRNAKDSSVEKTKKFYKKYVNQALLQEVLTSTIFEYRSKLGKNEFNRDGYFEFLEGKIKNMANGPRRDALFSFMMEVGTGFQPGFSYQVGEEIENNVPAIEDGYSEAMGMAYLIKNVDFISRETGIHKSLIQKKADAYDDFLSAFFSYFGSLQNRKYAHTTYSGWGQFTKATKTVNSNREDTIKKSELKENMNRVLFDENGMFSSKIMSAIINEEVLKVSSTDVKVNVGNGVYESIFSGKIRDDKNKGISSVNAKLVLDILGVPGISIESVDAMNHRDATIGLANNIYNLLLAIKVRHMQNMNAQKQSKHADVIDLSELNKLTDDTIHVFRAYEWSAKKQKSNRKGLDLKGVVEINKLSSVELVTPLDNWKFLEQISNAILKDSEDTIKRVEFVLGKTYFSTPPSSNLMDHFGEGNYVDPASSRFSMNLKAKLEKIKEEKGKLNTPVVSKDGSKYYNPILNGSIVFDKLYVMTGMETDRRQISNDQMSKVDFLKNYLETLTYDSMNQGKSYKTVSTMLDIQGDRKSLPYADVSFSIDGYREPLAYTSRKRKNIYSMEINKRLIEHLSGQMAGYYQRMREISLNDWNNAFGTKHTTVKALREDLAANPNSYPVETARYFLEDAKDYKVKRKGDTVYLEMGNVFNYEANPYNKLSETSSYDLIKKAFQDQYDQMADIIEELVDLSDGRFKLPNQADLGEISEDRSQWHPLIEAAMWSHHFLNESVNALVRGSAITYSNTNDYVKRAGGTAPGTILDTSNRMGVRDTARVVVMEDQWMKGIASNKMYNPTDGGSLMNPVFNLRMRRSLGGVSSILQDGSVKPVNFGYDATTGQKYYLKMSQLPITSELFFNNSYHQRALRMMMGDTLFNKYFQPLLENTYDNKGVRSAVFKNAVEEIAFGVDSNGNQLYDLHRNELVDYMVYSSSYKSGGKGIQQFQEDGSFPLDANSKAIEISNKTYRIQQVTSDNIFDAPKSIPTQILFIISGLNHNRKLSKRINKALSHFANKTTNKILSLNTLQQRIIYINKIAFKNVIKTSDTDKFARLVSTIITHPDINTNKFTSAFLSKVNKSLKPEMTGSSYVQQPHLGYVYETKNGSVYMATDMGAHSDEVEIEGATRRELNILHYSINGEKIYDLTNPAQLDKLIAAGKNVQLHPMEVIMPFPHMKKFGMTKESSLREFMNFGGLDMNNPLMTMTKDGLSHRSIAETYKMMDEYIKENGLNKDELIASIPEGIRSLLKISESADLFKLAEYYTDLNNALDLFSVIIPSRNASYGSVSRIIGFSYESNNTVFTSPEKSIFDGSNYQSSKLHIYSRSLNKKGSIKRKGKREFPNILLESIMNYYANGKNAKMIYQKVSTLRLEELVNTLSKPEYHGASLPSHIELAMESYSDKNMINYLANFENFIFKLMAIPLKKRKKIFTKLPLLTNDKHVDNAINFITKLINTASNSKNEGILSKLNINSSTIPILYGAIASGMNETKINQLKIWAKDIYDHKDSTQNQDYENMLRRIENNPIEEYVVQLLNMDVIRKAASKVMYTDSILHSGKRKKIWTVLSNISSLDNFNILDDTIQYSLIGEQIKRFGSVVKLQQGLSFNAPDLLIIRNNIEFILGSSLDEFLNQAPANCSQQISYSIENEFNFDPLHEKSIRKVFNIREVISSLPNLKSYIISLNTSIKFMESTFSIMNLYDLENQVAKNINLTRFQYRNHYVNYFKSVQSYIESLFISYRFKKVTINKSIKNNNFTMSYNFSNENDRNNYIKDFVNYSKQWKENTNNSFLKRLKIRTEPGTKLPIVEFANSTNLKECDILGYLSDFQKLSPEIQEAIRAYQMLRFGFVFRRGSFIDVIDNKIENDYKDWITKNPIKEMNHDIEYIALKINFFEKC